MRFDGSARTQHTLRKTWASDPRLLRFSVVKMAEKLSEISSVGGKAEEWAHVMGSEGSTGLTHEETSMHAVSNAVNEVRRGRPTSFSGGKYNYRS